jgi:mannose-1-phosphate guanylyltransferase/mannose-6-phosphate isomerase
MPVLFPVILSGGFGGRLWPVSRASLPKQFIPFLTDKTLLQETLARLHGLDKTAPHSLICNSAHRFLAAEQVRQIGMTPRRIFLEPCSRNTAPAIALTAFDILESDPDGVLLVLPSDHTILHLPSFHQAIKDAMAVAEQGYLVTFGVQPNSPKTGYGYIQQGEKIDFRSYHVSRFVEKPDAETAKSYLDAKTYLWNSGIFMFKASCFLEELKQFCPETFRLARQALAQTRHELDFSWIDKTLFEQCHDESIDYALMEKTRLAAVIPVDMGWSDIGSWGSLWEIVNKDSCGNSTEGNVFLKDVSNCYIKSSREIVAMLGLDNLIIIDTNDALLVAHRDKEQEVKAVFRKLM